MVGFGSGTLGFFGGLMEGREGVLFNWGGDR